MADTIGTVVADIQHPRAHLASITLDPLFNDRSSRTYDECKIVLRPFWGSAGTEGVRLPLSNAARLAFVEWLHRASTKTLQERRIDSSKQVRLSQFCASNPHDEVGVLTE